MIKLILSAIIVIGTIFTIVWQRYYTKESRKERLLEELAEITDEMDSFPTDGDITLYHKLQNRRMQLNEAIARLSK